MPSGLRLGIVASMLVVSLARAVTFEDPAGDILEVAQPPALDLTGISAEVNRDHVLFSLTFSETTSLSTVPLLSGSIEIDADRNTGTGRDITRLDEYELAPRINMGVDYRLEFIPGNPQVDFFYLSADGSEFTLPNCVRTVLDRTVTLEVPRSNTSNSEGLLLGPAFDMLIVVGNLSGPTDRAPNGESPLSVVVPEPAAALLTAVAACLVRRRTGRF